MLFQDNSYYKMIYNREKELGEIFQFATRKWWPKIMKVITNTQDKILKSGK